MQYLTAENLSKSYTERQLFADVTLHISRGEKIALVARNGAGKSTLLRTLAGLETTDTGKLWINREVNVCYLEQNPVLREDLTVLDNILHHDHPLINTVREYEAAVAKNDEQAISQWMLKMDEAGAWNFENKVKEILSTLQINQWGIPVASLSGGQKKRLALAKTLIEISFGNRHNLLLLDEPTNHLDFDMIEWLADFLSDATITLLLVTHDRYFLDSVCNVIAELTPNGLQIHKGNYEYYLQRKAEREENEAASLDKARNRYRKELEWMRRQPKARTTKSKSRQEAFYEIEEFVSGRRRENPLQLQVKMSRIGGKILELKKVYKRFGDRIIMKGFDYTFKKGERIGIIGRNGVGKSTFLNVILGLEPADSGKINPGETIVFGYFSQKGLELKEDKRVIEYVRSLAEHFPLADGTKVSATQFLQRFQFSPDQHFTYISKLSGGEKKRLQLIATLFRNPNFLVLDEPTNDLDLVTLAALEEFLQDFQGCLLMVSHDRYFMDKLVDHLFVFEGDGVISDFPGNYSQWRMSQKLKTPQKEMPANHIADKPNPEIVAQPLVHRKKLTYKEKTEFETLSLRIPELEQEKTKINDMLTRGNLPYEELRALTERLQAITDELNAAEFRWLELSEKANGFT
ncbi:MAG: ABC-F family ATP-binding cassette domain-containing protein [Chitinophagales bacterium]|nr:ABC-F family ATP-binding cassette domain-containing protein [Chitinophagales bacterium]MDW8418968.1 ABC-F family ATP-binding cassette domain-containing protein [Chitinophagales bacterium]